MIFFTSDTHFGDNGIIKRENRPYKNHKHFQKDIIKIWNKQTTKNDIIYVLGDFFNYNKKDTTSWKNILSLPKKFKAKIILIIGNNEERIIDNEFDKNFDLFKNLLLENGFLDVKKDDFVTINNTLYYLNHYPENKKDDCLNLFGHTHRSTGLWKPFGFNMDCDLNFFRLFSEKDIITMTNEKGKFWDSDINVTIM